MLYPVFESFHSFQGEGEFLGRSAFFIRLFGCPIRCPWCDSAETWGDVPERAENIAKIDAGTLADAAAGTHPDCVVITGGEPAIHNLAPLCDALHARNLRVHIETSGAFPIRGNVDWLTLSPKLRRLPLAENWARANEIKWIIDAPETLELWEKLMPKTAATSIWLHPEWSRRNDSAVLEAIAAWVRSRGAPFRAGWQIHKLFRVR